MDGTPQILVDLTDRVDNPGDSWSYSGTLALGGYEQGGKEFSLVDGVAFDAVFTNAGDGILLTGMVRAEARGTCDRCLEPASFEIAGELQEYYLFREPEGADDASNPFAVLKDLHLGE